MEVQTQYETKALAKYSEFNLADIKQMVAQYKTIFVPEDDSEAFKEARKALTTCVRTRTAIDKHRKALGADLRAQLADINDTGKMLIDAIAPAEKHLSTEVYREQGRLKAIEDEKERLKKEIIAARVEELTAYLPYTPLPPYEEIEGWDDEQFSKHCDSAKFVFETEQARIAEEKRIEDERKAAEDAARKAEDERLAKIRAEQEKQMAAIKAEQDRYEAAIKIENDRLKAEKAEIEAEKAKFKAEQDKAEREKMVKEAEERARLQAVADEKERVEREAKEAEEKAAAEKAEAERVAALMPDKDRAVNWIEDMRESTPKIPAIKDRNIALMVVTTLDNIKGLLDELHKDVEEA